MRTAQDSFAHYLADNLAPIPVHIIRVDKNSPGNYSPQANAVNLQFLNSDFGVLQSMQLLTIDVINDDEVTSLDWLKKVADILLAGTMIPKYEYSTGSPVLVAGQIFWSPTLSFQPISDGFYFRHTASLRLTFRYS